MRINRMNVARMVAAGGLQYFQKVKNLFGSSLLAHYPFTSNANDISGNGKNGTVSGSVAFGGAGVGMIPAVSGYVNAPQTLMDSNLGEFTISCFINHLDTTWSDGLPQYLFYLSSTSADPNNRFFVAKMAAGNLTFTYIAGGVNKTVSIGAIKHSIRIHVAMSVSKSNDRVRVFINGIPTIDNLTGLGTFDKVTQYLHFGNNTTNGWVNNIHDLVVIGRGITDAEARLLANYTNPISRLFAVDGDSRSASKSWLQSTYPTVNAKFGMTGLGMWGISGQTVATMITNAATNIDTKMIPGGVNTLIVWGGVNDCTTANASTIYSRLQTYCTARKSAGWNKVLVCTEIDAQDATRNTAGWHATIYPALNTILRADHSWADGLIDLGADARLQNALDTIYFTADAVHLTEVGYDIVAGIVGTALV